MLPIIKLASPSFESSTKKLLIIAEGFEKRSLKWISNRNNKTMFYKAIICKYSPSKKSRFDEMIQIVKQHSIHPPQVLEYNRFEPTIFEHEFKEYIDSMSEIQEIIIDISVMSKLLIMIILCSLGKFEKKVTLIYSEPMNWGPTEKKFHEIISNRKYGTCIGLSSVGVGTVVRTPLLSSIIMQNSPIYLIAFLSFNEQLINVLINEISPTKLQVINHKCSRVKWREDAMLSIHKELIEENKDNESDSSVKSFELTDYKSVFNELASIYRNNCYNYRIVVSPTGCKVHAVSCALFKLCCPDVHIEYPTPESYLFDEYSSEKVSRVHEIVFDNLSNLILCLKKEYHLNG